MKEFLKLYAVTYTVSVVIMMQDRVVIPLIESDMLPIK